jgi:hypothetical protein
MTPSQPRQNRYRCRSCGRELPGWIPVAHRPNGAMRLHHLGDMHPTEVRPYLKRMRTEDIATVAAVYEIVNLPEAKP